MPAKSLEEQMVDALRLWPPDFLLAEELLARGADVNAVVDNEDENVLSAVILGYPEGRFELSELEEDGRYLPDIIRWAIAHGFDVTQGNGVAGAKCLENLTWASYDDYILEAAKLLLDAGVDPNADPHPEETERFGHKETVIEWVRTKRSGEVMAHDNYESSNRFCVMYDILDAAIKGWDYHAIYNCYRCVGKKITGVELCGAGEKVTDLLSKPYRLPAPVVFYCEGLALCVHHKYLEIYVGHQALKENPGRFPSLAPQLLRCVGHTITDIYIPDGDDTGDCREIIVISLDDGSTLQVNYKNKQAYLTQVPEVG